GLLFQSEVKEHLNCVIDFVEKSDIKQISAYTYYSHMRSLRNLIVKEMYDKPQKKIEHYFKPNK
ncbi:hypothetical protein C0J52_03542, partial [Blattella germanica]